MQNPSSLFIITTLTVATLSALPASAKWWQFYSGRGNSQQPTLHKRGGFRSVDFDRQEKTVALADQIAMGVRKSDMRAVITALRQLDKVPVDQITEPLTVLLKLSNALGNEHSQWLDPGLMAQIARQAERFAQRVFILSQESGKRIWQRSKKSLLVKLDEAQSLVNERQQSSYDLRFQLDCLQTVIRNTPDTTSKWSIAGTQLVNLIKLIKGKGDVDTAKELLAAIVKASKKVSSAHDKTWYQKVLFIEILRDKAGKDQNRLHELQQLMLDNQRNNWHTLHAGLDALRHVVQTGDSDLQALAWHGSGKLLGLKHYIGFDTFAFRNNWRIRSKAAGSILLLTTHPDKKIAQEATQLLKKRRVKEKDPRVMLVLNSEKTLKNLQQALHRDWSVQRESENSTTVSRRLSESIPQPPAHNLPDLDEGILMERKELLQDIQEQLESSSSWSTSILTVHGMGGVGKSMLATAYAHQQLGSLYETAWWVDARNMSTLMTSLRNMAEQMGLDTKINSDKDILPAIRKWLQEHPNWLLVLDNADDPSVLQNLWNQSTRQNKLYPSRGGHVLITSRSDNDQINTLRVPVFTQQEAIKFLFKHLRVSTNSKEQAKLARQLANELGYHPLALAQAGQYMKKNRRGFSDYLTLIKQHALEFKHQLDHNYNRQTTARTTLTLSYNSAVKKNRYAADIAAVMAHLDGNGIPESWFKSLIPNDPHQLALFQALASLQDHVVIDSQQKGLYTMHRPQQSAIRHQLQQQKNGEEKRILQLTGAVLQQAWNAQKKDEIDYQDCLENNTHIFLKHAQEQKHLSETTKNLKKNLIKHKRTLIIESSLLEGIVSTLHDESEDDNRND